MKVFCFIFSVYILLLSLAPCSEMIEFAESLNKKPSQQVTLQNDNKTDANGENCSPFCICSCCHFSTVYQFKTFSVTSKQIVQPVSTNPNFYQNPYAKEYKTSVWQPPKFNSIG